MDSELYHHGIKGQRWGYRRYQNPDGSLTEEGYRHYGINSKGKRIDRRNYSQNTKNASISGAIGGAVSGGVTSGPAGAFIGLVSGAAIGTVYGAIDTSLNRRKIRKLLDENGIVYVKDL